MNPCKCFGLFLAGFTVLPGGPSLAADAIDNDYFVYVAAESEDTVHLVKFGPDGGELVYGIHEGFAEIRNGVLTILIRAAEQRLAAAS